jgi:hypothetical protein
LRFPKRNSAPILGLASYPKPDSIASDEKERDRVAEHATIWPRRKIDGHADRLGRFTLIESRLIALYGRAKRSQWK